MAPNPLCIPCGLGNIALAAPLYNPKGLGGPVLPSLAGDGQRGPQRDIISLNSNAHPWSQLGPATLLFHLGNFLCGTLKSCLPSIAIV